jgi:hypothetical protein
MNNAKISFLSRAAAAVLFSLSGLLAGCQAAKVTGQMASSGTELTDQLRVGEYQIRTFRTGEGDGWAEITKAGRLVYRREGWSFKIGTMSDWVKQDCRQWEGKDITGSGKPAVILYEWTGGAHGLYDAFVVELDTPVAGLITPCKEIAEIHGTYSVPRFVDLDSDGRPEIIINDWSYAFWPEDLAHAYAPKVVLKWRNGRYTIAEELMHKPAPTDRKLKAMAKEVREEWLPNPEGQGHAAVPYERAMIPSDLYQIALDLMYSGHEKLGWQFINMAWSPQYPMDAAVFKELKERMSQSEWWQALTKQPAPVPAVPPQEWAMRKWRELEKQESEAAAKASATNPPVSRPAGETR